MIGHTALAYATGSVFSGINKNDEVPGWGSFVGGVRGGLIGFTWRSAGAFGSARLQHGVFAVVVLARHYFGRRCVDRRRFGRRCAGHVPILAVVVLTGSGLDVWGVTGWWGFCGGNRGGGGGGCLRRKCRFGPEAAAEEEEGCGDGCEVGF